MQKLTDYLSKYDAIMACLKEVGQTHTFFKQKNVNVFRFF